MKQLLWFLIISVAFLGMPLTAAWAQCEAATTIWAENARDEFGFRVIGNTDVNNDGSPDIIVSARVWSMHTERVVSTSTPALILR